MLFSVVSPAPVSSTLELSKYLFNDLFLKSDWFIFLFFMNVISLTFSSMTFLIGGGKNIVHFVLSYDSVSIIGRQTY